MGFPGMTLLKLANGLFPRIFDSMHSEDKAPVRRDIRSSCYEEKEVFEL